MESLGHDLWERFDFDPSCHPGAADADVDFDFDTLAADFGSEACRSPGDGDDPFGLGRDDDLEDAEALFRGLEGLTAGDLADDLASALLAPKMELEAFGATGCDLCLSGGADTLKSDCMWSSTLSNAPPSPARRPCGRRRDFSLTLSEGPDPEGFGGVQPGLLSGLCPLFDTPLATSESDTESAGTDDDAVLVPFVAARKPKLEAGRSLLLSSNRDLYPRPETGAPSAGQQTFIDHCYFSVQPPSPPSVRGLLTPTESSDDDDGVALVPGSIDKRKLAHAVQSLMKKNRVGLPSEKAPSSHEAVKFKFRMKFKSDSLLAVNRKHRRLEKRRAVLKRPGAPEPVPVPKSQPSLLVRPRPPPSPKSGKASPASRRASPHQDKKVREIRDLHNSMERQRRVDLRKNFDRLKSVVPELAEMEKASKLNILNKAALYCSQLTHADAKLKKEADREAAKHQQLRKKLRAFQNAFSHGVKLSSGRISVVNSRASY